MVQLGVNLRSIWGQFGVNLGSACSAPTSVLNTKHVSGTSAGSSENSRYRYFSVSPNM